MFAEAAQLSKENEQKFAETEKLIKENARSIKETEKTVKELSRNIGSISNSNGEMAEEYFYSAFRANKTFANEKFDKVKRNLTYQNDEDVEAEFDIVLFNGKSVAIIEVKYNAKPENISIEKLISRIEVFKILCPKYKEHKIYLGVAAMSFRKGLEEKLHRSSIATIRQIGKKMVRFDKDVKAF